MSDRVVYLYDQDLTGAEGGRSIPLNVSTGESLTHLPITVAAKILKRFKPSTHKLILSSNVALGLKGLKHLVDGMKKQQQQQVWELRELYLPRCGLGGASEFSFILVFLSYLKLRSFYRNDGLKQTQKPLSTSSFYSSD